jgi:TonB family protein
MVRAIPTNPWRGADFLERLRPGLALSAALHAALLIALAYFLAFHPAAQLQPTELKDTITMVEFPPPPPKTQLQQPPKFQLDIAPPIDDIQPTVPPLPVLPQQPLERPPAEATSQTAPPADIILNPRPIFRGGLVYPERAAEAGIPGYVDFSFIIEPDGSVGDPQVTEEVPYGYGFATAAKNAFPKWRFEPRQVNGKPVASAATIRISFKLK